MTGLKDFSTDAASNDTAAPPINWQEGMPARVTNDSARAMMAALACWHADQSGGLAATGGAASAYAVGTNQGFTAADYAKPFELAFSPDVSNPGPCTLNPDGAGVKPLRRPRGIELAPNDVQVGTIYRVRWHPGTGQFTVVSPSFEAPGTIKAFASASAVPPGWLSCDGSAASRTAYAALFVAIGGTWGVGNGSTTFNVPDLRGRVPVGADGGTNRLTGAGGLAGGVGSVGGAETVALAVTHLASHSHGGSTAGAGAHDHGGGTGAAGQHSHGGGTGGAGSHTHAASADAQGSHTHTGTTDTGGAHGHQLGYQVNVAGSGSSNRVVSDLAPNGSRNANGGADADGVHQHSFTTQAAGNHSHAITVNGVGDHAHGIAADGNHAHAIAGVGDHAHGLSISATGDGAAHPNMPPGAVVVWAIKA